MRHLFLIIIIIASFSESQAQRSRKFTPVYGNDTDINRTLEFVTEHLIFDSLTYTRLGNLEGYVRCSFMVSPNGKIEQVRIMKGLAQWIDYEIQVAMNRMPAMVPFTDKNGKTIQVKRDVYFTFGIGDENPWRSPYTIPDNTAKSIELQRKQHFDSTAKMAKAWTEFTKDNTKISIDGKSIYKPGILPNNPLKINPPTTRPPISITIKSE